MTTLRDEIKKLSIETTTRYAFTSTDTLESFAHACIKLALEREPSAAAEEVAMEVARYEYGHGVTRSSIVAIRRAITRELLRELTDG